MWLGVSEISEGAETVIREIRADDVDPALEVLTNAFLESPITQLTYGTGKGARARARAFSGCCSRRDRV
jgi:hypothetical protein